MAKIIYLMGPSGSGKDSIISALRKHLHPGAGLMIAHRYITRHWQSGGENHIELTDTEFALRKNLGLFSLSWEANGHQYGIGSEVDTWLKANHSVIVNGSREHLPEAIEHYAEQLIPVLIDVEETSLRERLTQRSRESGEEIEARILRSRGYAESLNRRCYVISNNGDLDQAVTALARLIDQLTTATINV
ncbi:ribose 1,5-bisphosphokinase [Neptunomonas antarctica]|uniref:Ribose 1,5-bisphosphate phosphokinase PhnN n=1 Tax=Neptunomonas antarctica TaxID=619304 RepID=A0A1N7JUS0_9GAMM|nr:ribose 1,5-bisphosphokinase [Neptunomonas antarctica]SIS53021.1 ribose 1,5-bisphosphokinase [Neptunomonas antarctica]